MNHLSRRQLLQFGIASTFTQSQESNAAQTGEVVALDYGKSGFRGFAIDSVEHRGNDQTYFDELAATGANIARIFFPFRKCKNCTQYGRNPADTSSLFRILGWANSRNIKIVVTGIFDDQGSPSFWYDKSLRDSFVENWEWFAQTFQNHPALAGLDLMNEPNPPRLSGKVSEANEFWRPLAARAIAAIRATGVKVPIIYEGFGGGQSIGLRDFEPFSDSQIVYSVHVYTPHAITHQNVSATKTKVIPYPSGVEWQLADAVLMPGAWNADRLELALQDTITFQKRNNINILVGEFSCIRWAPAGSSIRYVRDCLNIFTAHGWSWCYHEFRGWPGWDAEVDSVDPDVTTRSKNAPTMALIKNSINAK